MFGWWHSFWGGVKHTVEDIWNALWSAVGNVVHWAENWYDRIAHAVDWVWNHLGRVWGFLKQLVPAVWHAIDRVWGWIVHAFFPWVGRMFGDVFHYVGGAVKVVTDWAGRIVGDLWHWTRNSFQWLHDHVEMPLWNGLHGFVHWVTTTMWHVIWGWVKDLGHWAGRALGYLFDHLAGLVTYIDRHLSKWIPVLDRYAGSFLRFLLNPGGYITSFIESAFARGGRWFTRLILQALAEDSDAVEHLVERFLSL